MESVQAHSSALPELPVEFWTPKGVWTAIPVEPFIHADSQSPPTLLGNRSEVSLGPGLRLLHCHSSAPASPAELGFAKWNQQFYLLTVLGKGPAPGQRQCTRQKTQDSSVVGGGLALHL